MLNGISKEAIEIAKTTKEINCRPFTEDGEEYDGVWQKETFKRAIRKPNSRILIGSPDIISSEILFIKCYEILEKQKLNCFLLTEFYIRSCQCNELISKCDGYDYIFVNGIGSDSIILSAIRRLLQSYDLGLILSYKTFYMDYNKNKILREHNPISFDNECLGWNNFDSYIFQNRLITPKEIQKLKCRQ